MRYTFDDYEFDTQARELRRSGVPITLAPKVYHVLAHLIQHRDRLVTKDELLEQVWPNAYVDDSSVKHCIMAARRALAERAGTPQYVKTMRGQGYRFVAAVREHDPLAAHDVEAVASLTVAVPESPAAAGPTAERSPPAAATPERRCAACQHVQSGTARFCSACGAPFGRMCSNCGEAVVHAVPFCPACGQGLTEGLPTPPSAPAVRHMPRLPSSTTRLSAGEHKLITALCGVVPQASTGAAVGLDDLHSLIRTVYDLALLEVQRYGGMLQAVTGDHFVALFGAPVAQEDHARRAVLAALGLQQRLRQAAVRLSSGEDLMVCLALHTGQVVVGPAGDDLNGTASVVGDTTTLVAALARRAQPGTILSSAATLRLVQEEVRTAALPSLVIEGQSTPVPVHQVLEFAPQRGRQMATASRTHSLFLGREAELALLHTLWARVERGQGQVVGVAGEPGLGKSRLLEEFQRAISTPVATVLRGYCQSYGSTIPYLPLIDLLRSAWGMTEADDAATMLSKGQVGLLSSGLVPQTWAPSLLSLLGLPAAAEPLAGLSPDLRKARTFEALHQVLLPHDWQPPRLLALENLHWIDATSEAYLATLVEQLAGTPTLLLVTYRPGYRPAWLEKSYATQMTLQALEPEASRRVLRAVVGHTPLPTVLEQQVLAKAEGNPFFLEELAHAVVEQGGDVPDVAVPDTIQAVLAARIDRLPLAEKQLLQAAAVIGRDVPGRLLQAITALPEAEVHERLVPLRAAEFLYDTRHVPERIYAFKHALTHEVAYGSLLQEQRRTLHRQVLTALEELADAPAAAQVDRRAHHALHGEVWDKALRYCRHGGRQRYGAFGPSRGGAVL